MKFRFFYTLGLFLITSAILSGQALVLEGILKDQSGGSIDFADVVVKTQDGDLIAHSGTLDGVFKMEGIQPGNYLVEVIALGYTTYSERIELLESRTLEISLKTDKEILDEVTVVGIRKAIKYEDGNTKVDMVNSIFAEQASTLDALSMMPGLIVDPSMQNLNLIGRGSPLLYLRNRRITIDELQAIPIQDIASVEIINNPSARYEASGRSVLKIVLKKNLNDGYNLTLSNNLVKRRNFNNYLAGNASLRSAGLEAKINLGYNQLGTWEGGDYEMHAPAGDLRFSNSSVADGIRPQIVGGAGVYYQINKGDYISLNASTRHHTTDVPVITNSVNEIENRVEEIYSKTEEDEVRGFTSVNFNYNDGFNGGKSNLLYGLQFSDYYRNVSSEIFNTIGTSMPINDQSRRQEFGIKVLAGRIDFETELNKGQRLELGTNVYRGDANAYQFIRLGSDGMPTDYDYLESNLAFYGQVNSAYKGVRYVLGLRSESTRFFGEFEGETTPAIDASQTNFFPRLNLSFNIDSIQRINLNFSSSISRPDYLNASSISTFLTPYLEYSRNPNLRPSIAQYLSLTYQYDQQSLNITAYNRKNVVQQNFRYDEESGRIIQSPENFNLEEGLNIRVNNNFAYGIWSFDHMTMFSFNRLKDDRALAQKVRPFLYLYGNHRFRLGKGFTFALNGYYLSRRNSGVYDRNSMLIIGSTLTKRIGAFNLSLGATDILRQANFESVSTINGVFTNSQQYADQKSYSIALRYNFGKRFKSNYRTVDTDENLRRMN